MALKNLIPESKIMQQVCPDGVVVSVIVPIYNVESCLERCLNSIIRQTFSNIEIICVDDGSTDGSGKILDRLVQMDSRVILIHKKNGGVSSARNTALSFVKGQYVCFVDSDDWLENNAIEELVAHMTDGIDIVVAGAQIEDEGGDSAERLQQLRNIYSAKLNGPFTLADNSINKVTITVWGKLFRYEIIKNTGLTFLDGRKYEDNHFTVEYLVHSRMVYFVNKNLYHYVRQPNAITNSVYSYQDCLYVFDHLYKRLESFGLLNKYKNTISICYAGHLKLAYEKSPSYYRCDVMKLATLLAQDYNPAFFNNGLVYHVRSREYGLISLFDKDVLIILKATGGNLSDAFKTVKSIFAQSYKLPKVLLLVSGAENEEEDDFLKNIPKELTNHIDKELIIEFSSSFSLTDIKSRFPNRVILTAESGIVYPGKWLRSVMAAYSYHKEAFKSLVFVTPDTINDEILFKDFAVIDVDSFKKSNVFKSKQIIVSVTSSPVRINSAALALETMYKQTRTPDKVVLWLVDSQFPDHYENLPKELLRLVSEKGLEIQWCDEDLKPHNKYFYAFQKYPDGVVITIDDDILYPPQRISNLYLSYLLHPHSVSAARAHLIPVSESGEILSYNLWPQEIDAYQDRPSMQLFATGAGGVLYSTVLFSDVRDLLDKEAIKRTCLYADDFWLKAMELVAGIPVVVAEEFLELQYTSASRGTEPRHEDENGERNDRQLLRVEEEIDRRYGKGTFRKKLLDTAIGEKLIGVEVLSKLVSFYKTEVNKKVNQVKQQYSKYSALRVDIRNIGSESSNVIEQSVIPASVSLQRPGWLKNGITADSVSGKMKLVVQCQGDGELVIGLMGRDVRNADGTRYPVWIDCNFFAVNEEVVFNSTKTVCNGKPYIYRRKVIDDEIVTLDLAWSECRSMSLLDEFRQIQTSLRNTNAKVSKTEVALKNANAKLSSAEDTLKNVNAKLSLTEDTLKNANAKLSSTEDALKNANAKLSSTEDALKNANAKLSSTEDALKNAKAKVNATESALKNANSMIASSQKKLLVVGEDNKRLKAQINNLKGSVSFKIGRALTWLPRKFRGGVKCLKQHGFSYTVKRTIEHMGIDMGTKDYRKK